MSDVVIRVENLGKMYRIGRARQRHDTMRDALVDGLRAPLSWLRRDGRPDGDASEDRIWALKDVSFEVKRGEVVGIIGRNGAGKSTLLKILSRITEPTAGRARVKGKVRSLLEVGTGFHQELTGRENTYFSGAILGMSRAEIDRKFDEIVDFSGVEKFIDTPVKRYSSGMQVRLGFAVAAHLEPEVLLVDEVLAVGDAEFQTKCLGKMEGVAKEGRTVLFVSHNMAAIESLCGVAVIIETGSLAYQGDPTEGVQSYLSGLNNPQGGQSARSHRVSLAQLPRRHSSGTARLLWVALMDGNGSPCTTFSFGQCLRMRVAFEVTQAVGVGVQAVLKSHLAEKLALFATERFDTGSLIDAVAERQNVVELVIPSLPLARGQYSFDVGVSFPFVKWLDYVEDACRFTVELSDPGGTGRHYEQRGGLGSVVIDQIWETSEVSEEGRYRPAPNGRRLIE